MHTVVISGAARTPMGGFQGDLNGVPAAELGGAAIRAAMEGAACRCSLFHHCRLRALAQTPQHQAPQARERSNPSLGSRQSIRRQ